jgi:hypothetical protein
MLSESQTHRAPHPALRNLPPAFLPPVQDRSQPVEELLPFTVRFVCDQEGLRKATTVRHSAYARHLPEFAETLRHPEPADQDKGVVILLAESKVDGTPLGTMRIHSDGTQPLPLEQSLDLPDWLKSAKRAEATRLAVSRDREGQLVKTILFKAYFKYCQAQGVEWLVIAGRSPVDRQYERLLFSDVFPNMGYIPLRHAGDIPHRVMCFNVDTAEQLWKCAEHSLYDFIFKTNHPDINFGISCIDHGIH